MVALSVIRDFCDVQTWDEVKDRDQYGKSQNLTVLSFG